MEHELLACIVTKVGHLFDVVIVVAFCGGLFYLCVYNVHILVYIGRVLDKKVVDT